MRCNDAFMDFLLQKVMELYGEEQYIVCKELIFPAYRIGQNPPPFFCGNE
jgi:hypothetical protein